MRLVGLQPARVATDLAVHVQRAVAGAVAAPMGRVAERACSAAAGRWAGAARLAGLAAQGGAGTNVGTVGPRIIAQDVCSVLAVADRRTGVSGVTRGARGRAGAHLGRALGIGCA